MNQKFIESENIGLRLFDDEDDEEEDRKQEEE